MSTTTPLLHVERRDRVALVTLDDPTRRNALSAALCASLVATLDELDADDSVGALVVTGAGPAFCAGADLSQLGGSREEGLLGIYDGFLRIARSSLPSIAAVNGAAVGAGMNLALACDVRIAGRSARFDTRFLDPGIRPAVTLPRGCSRERTRRQRRGHGSSGSAARLGGSSYPRLAPEGRGRRLPRRPHRDVVAAPPRPDVRAPRSCGARVHVTLA